MKRYIFLLFIVLVLVTFMASGTELRVWLVGMSNERIAILDGMTNDSFTSKTGISVKYTGISWIDYYNKYLLALASKDTPDLLTLGSETMDFGLRGGLVDLKKLKPGELEKLESELFSSIFGPVSFKGTRFGLPMELVGIFGAYRTDILRDLGMDIPKEWEYIKKWQPKALAQKKTFGIHYGTISNEALWGAYTLITQNGGQFFNADGLSSALDRPESIKGFEEYIDLFLKHKLPQATVGLPPFIDGEWISYTDGAWLYHNLESAAPQLNGKWTAGVVPGTRRSDGSIHHGTFVGGVNLAMSAYSKNKEAAWQLMKWLLSKETQTLFSNQIVEQISASVWLPANKYAYKDLHLKESYKQTFFNQVEASETVPPAINVNVLYRYVKLAIDKAILNKINPKTAIVEAARDMNSEMNRRKKEYSRFLAELKK